MHCNSLVFVTLVLLVVVHGAEDELTHSMKNLDRSIATLALALLEDRSLPPTDAVELGDEIRAFQSEVIKEPTYGLPGRRDKYGFHIRASRPLLEKNEHLKKVADPYEIETMTGNQMSPQFLKGQSMRQRLKDYLKKFEVESDVSIIDEDIEASNHPLDLAKYVLPNEDYAGHFIRVDSLSNSDARADILTAVDKEDTEMVQDQFGNPVPVIPGIDANGVVSREEIVREKIEKKKEPQADEEPEESIEMKEEPKADEKKEEPAAEKKEELAEEGKAEEPDSEIKEEPAEEGKTEEPDSEIKEQPAEEGKTEEPVAEKKEEEPAAEKKVEKKVEKKKASKKN